MALSLVEFFNKRDVISIIEKIDSINSKKYRITYNYDNIQGSYVIKFSHKYLFKYRISTAFSESDFIHSFEVNKVHQYISFLKSNFSGMGFVDIANIPELL